MKVRFVPFSYNRKYVTDKAFLKYALRNKQSGNFKAIVDEPDNIFLTVRNLKEFRGKKLITYTSLEYSNQIDAFARGVKYKKSRLYEKTPTERHNISA